MPFAAGKLPGYDLVFYLLKSICLGKDIPADIKDSLETPSEIASLISR